MEYKDWEKWEKEYPWLWRIVYEGLSENRTIVCKRANWAIPLTCAQTFPDSRVWIASGAIMGAFRRPRVFDVREIPWEPGLSLREQIKKSGWRSGFYALYLVLGTIRPDPEGVDLTMYKRPDGVEDFRSMF